MNNYEDHLVRKHILAIDPGPSTGMAICREDQFDIWTADLTSATAHLDLYKVLSSLSVDQLILEPFEFRKDKERDKIDYRAAEFVGIIRMWAQMRCIPVRLQNGSVIHTGAFFAGTEGKKKLGKMLRGCVPLGRLSEHAWDALRHLMHYRVFVLNELHWLEKLK